MKSVYQSVLDFKRKHPGGVAWRIKNHSAVVQKHINPDEEILYVFTGQKNGEWYNFINTYVIALTNKRLILGSKRVVFGYFFSSITPDLYNDMQIYEGLLWGRITIDTVKEKLVISNLPKSALDDIETNISEFMMKEKKKYGKEETEKNK